MPELPEVEILVRHLRPLIQGKTVREVNVRRAKSLRGTKENTFKKALTGARFTGLTRRGKYLLFELRPKGARDSFQMLGHLGMTGRMYLQPKGADLAKHAAVVLALGRHDFVFEDTRYFGRLTLDLSSIDALGPEPLSENFTVDYFHGQLKRSAQPIKVKLLDQTLVAGIGNIYAGEALFHSGISPRRQSRRLARAQTALLLENVQRILSDAIALGRKEGRAFLLWQLSRLDGGGGRAFCRLREGRSALPRLRDSDQAHRSGRSQRVFLPEMPARLR